MCLHFERLTCAAYLVRHISDGIHPDHALGLRATWSIYVRAFLYLHFSRHCDCALQSISIITIGNNGGG